MLYKLKRILFSKNFNTTNTHKVKSLAAKKISPQAKHFPELSQAHSGSISSDNPENPSYLVHIY